MCNFEAFKAALCSLGRRQFDWLILFYFLANEMNKLSLFSWPNELNQQTDLKEQQSFTLFYFV